MRIEAMKQALEALEFDGFTPEDATHRSYHAKAIAAIKQALEQPEPEPVACEHITDGTECWCNPETVYVDPETDASVIVHKEPQ